MVLGDKTYDERKLIEACLSVPADVETVRLLLDQGVSANLISDMEYGISLLFDVMGNYYVDQEENHPHIAEGVAVMKLLVQHGAETVDKWGEPIIFEMDSLPDSPHTYEFIKFLLETVSTPFDVYDSGETIYEDISYEVFENRHDFEFYKKFLQILIAYGGNNQKNIVRPEVDGGFNLRKLIDLEKYTIEFEGCEDGYHIRAFIVEVETRKRVLCI